MSKRKQVNFDDIEIQTVKKPKETENVKKHSLDSDEEDDDNNEAYNIMDEDDIEGEEDGVETNQNGIRTTAFNMREEMEEGHFDKDGHFIWNKEKEIRDNWLDNIDWQQIKTDVPNKLGEESDSDEDEISKSFNEIECYKKILQFMEPKESISKTLCRLGGGNKKLSSVERLKLKKAGKLGDSEKVTSLTELANNFLNNTGNMDIYQETYESISKKIAGSENKTKTGEVSAELDMYADDFEVKEKERLEDHSGSTATKTEESDTKSELMWEFKWSQNTEEVEGPHTTEQMQQYVEEGKFKSGVWVRKSGQEQFYSSNRIDFELYLS